MEEKSFWQRQLEAYELKCQATRHTPLIEDFIASDPVNGATVKATEKKIEIGSYAAILGVGVPPILISSIRPKPPRSLQGAVLSLIGVFGVATVFHFGVSMYVLQEKDRMDAYVKFNEWLQERA